MRYLLDFSGKLRSPFLQKQLTQPEASYGREPTSPVSQPAAGKTFVTVLAYPGGWGGSVLERESVVGRRSQPAMSFAVGVCEELAPNILSSAQTEEEPTYEVPQEQDTLYEEPPLVGP